MRLSLSLIFACFAFMTVASIFIACHFGKQVERWYTNAAIAEVPDTALSPPPPSVV